MTHPAYCDGCMGDRRCWPCEGEGKQERPGGAFVPCDRCGGSGVCARCHDGVPHQWVDLTPAEQYASS